MATIRRSVQVSLYVVAGVLGALVLFAAFWGTVLLLPPWLSSRETPDSPRVRMALGGRVKTSFEEMLRREKAAYEGSWHPAYALGVEAPGDEEEPRVFAFYRPEDQLLLVAVGRSADAKTLPQPRKIADDPREGMIDRGGLFFLKYHIRDD